MSGHHIILSQGSCTDQDKHQSGLVSLAEGRGAGWEGRAASVASSSLAEGNDPEGGKPSAGLGTAEAAAGLRFPSPSCASWWDRRESSRKDKA